MAFMVIHIETRPDYTVPKPKQCQTEKKSPPSKKKGLSIDIKWLSWKYILTFPSALKDYFN